LLAFVFLSQYIKYIICEIQINNKKQKKKYFFDIDVKKLDIVTKN